MAKMIIEGLVMVWKLASTYAVTVELVDAGYTCRIDYRCEHIDATLRFLLVSLDVDDADLDAAVDQFGRRVGDIVAPYGMLWEWDPVDVRRV
jgi:hypothetical protein